MILEMDVRNFTLDLFTIFLLEHDKFITKHSETEKHLTKEFSDSFKNFIYNDICSYLPLDEELYSKCTQYITLEKGYHINAIYFWENLRRQIDHYLLNENKTVNFKRTILNLNIIISIDDMMENYIVPMFDTLIYSLDGDIKSKTNSQINFELALFITFILCVLII